MFPVDPGADATIGGMTATRASGTTAVRYGTMRENVLGLTVVLADGRVIHTGGRARKSSSGYDLTRLFVGSEGTLGVITEVTLRLFGRPEAVVAAVCPFDDDGGRGRHRDHDDSARHPGRAHRDHRRAAARVVNATRRPNYPIAPTLFFEFHGISQDAVDEQARAVQEIAAEHGALGFRVGVDARGARHALAGASQRALRDDCVAARRQALDVRRLRADLASVRVHSRDAGRSASVEHRGAARRPRRRRQFPSDLHGRSRRPAEMDRVKAANERLVERALRFGGTCSGEHGVGIGKLKYLAQGAWRVARR